MKQFSLITQKLALFLAVLAAGSFCNYSWAWVPNAQEEKIASYLASDPNQKRAELVFDPVLAEVARGRASDMAARGYFAHINPDGVTANYLVRQAGYGLPDWWDTDPTLNFIESIGVGYATAHGVWVGWMRSPEHRTHLLGLDAENFFARETHYGIGYVEAPGSKSIYYWVVITAPPWGVSIDSPTPGENLTSEPLNVAGTIPANTAITSITAQIEYANGITTPILASGTTNWNATLNGLASGQNLIRVQGKDANGDVISETAVKVTYTEMSPLVVSISGSGSVTATFSGTTDREVGKSYQIGATPAKGFLFSGWTGGIQSPLATLSFIMPKGLTLQANFVENPFPSAKGAYSGLTISGTDGFLKINLNNRGTFSAKMLLGMVPYNFTGRFSPLGQADILIKRLGMPSLAIHLDLCGSQQIAGTVTDGTLVSSFLTDLAVFGKTTPAPQAGNFTFAFTPANFQPESPIGNSIGTLRINDAGTAVFSGRLADNVHFQRTTTINKDGSVPLYLPLPNHRGLLLGILGFKTLAGSDATGKIHWTEAAAPQDTVYPLAFDILLNATVSSYVAPAILTPIPPPVCSVQIVDNQGTALIETPATVSTAGVIQFAGTPPSQLALSTNKRDGTISGSFIHPTTKAKCIIRAAYLQKQGAAFGYVSGKSTGGGFSVQPPPQ